MNEASLPVTVDVSRPDTITCLPPWLEVALTNLDEKVWTRPTIRSDLAPTEGQRRAIQQRLSSLDEAAMPGPWERSARAVGLLLVTYPAGAGEGTADAKVQAFRIALGDLPAWAVEEAVKAWLRGEVPEKTNTAFLPAPPQLRALALRKRSVVTGQRAKLQRLLNAAVVDEPKWSEAERQKRVARFRDLARGAAAVAAFPSE